MGTNQASINDGTYYEKIGNQILVMRDGVLLEVLPILRPRLNPLAEKGYEVLKTISSITGIALDVENEAMRSQIVGLAKQLSRDHASAISSFIDALKSGPSLAKTGT
jgi:hypothetical protein